MSMTQARVLVTYSTAAGSTAGIAERIAQVLRSAGCTVRCLPASAVPDVEGVDALVEGSAVHDMAWLAPSIDVLRRAAVSGPPAVWCSASAGCVRTVVSRALLPPSKCGGSGNCSPQACRSATIGCSAASWS